MFAPYKSNASAYSHVHLQTAVDGADPHRLVALLLDGAMGAIASAVNAMERRDIAAKGQAISRAVGIIDEGLRATLDRQAGGPVAQTLDDLYACVLLRLTEANLRNDAALLRQCSALLAPLREAWSAIKPQPMAA